MSGAKRFLIRLIATPIMVGFVLGVVYLDFKRGETFWLRFFVGAIGLFALAEVYSMGRHRGLGPAKVLGCVAVFFAISLPPWSALATLGFTLYVMVKLVFGRMTFSVEDAGFTLLGFFYVSLFQLLWAVPLSFAYYTWFLVYLLAASKVPDMAAYLVGKAIGRHRMAPVLSPNKTWEGGIGGFVAGTAAGAAVILLSPLREAFGRVPEAVLITMSSVITIGAIVGDLVKSALKRWAGVKDSRALLPEIGGILDIADSFLISAPAAYLMVSVLSQLY